MEATKESKIAITYARVSSKKQAKEGAGLESQITRCRQFAEFRGYEVVADFKDDITGKSASRNGLKALFAFLNSMDEEVIVLIDDISRLARSVVVHNQLYEEIKKAGGKLESPSIEFGESSDQKLIVNMLASVSQHFGDKNREQTNNRMRARLLNGYWPFKPPIGYKHISERGNGKIVVKDEVVAPIIAEALNGYATERFSTQSEVKRFLEDHPDFPIYNGKYIPHQRIREMLEKVMYAGYIEHAPWDVSRRKGQHEPLISFETHKAIQERLHGRIKVQNDLRTKIDFSLRGFVDCADCGNPLTACYSKSRNGTKHPYYLCQRKTCVSKGKSIRRADIEGEFENILQAMTPSHELMEIFSKIFAKVWNNREALEKEKVKSIQKQIGATGKQIEQLLDRILDTSSATLVSAYEKRLKDLEDKKLILVEKAAKTGKPITGYSQTYRTALEFLSNPQKLWGSDQLEDKRAVLKLAFDERLQYKRGRGFRTACMAQAFALFSPKQGGDLMMVPLTGFEPVAPSLRMTCSTN